MTAIPHTAPAAVHEEEHAHVHERLGFLKKYVFATDHKIIGLQFLFFGLLFMSIGGLLAMLIRWQLGWPGRAVPVLGSYMGWDKGVMPSDFYNTAFTMHATLMIWFVIIPLLVGVFGNYLIPLKIGAADMAFPFLNGASFWTALPAGAIMVAAFFMPGLPAQYGWTSYPPLSEITTNSGPLSAQYEPIPHVAPATPQEKWENNWHTAVQTIRITDAKTGRQGVWPTVPLVILFVSCALMWAYFCTYYVRLGFRPLDFLVSLVLCLVGALGLSKVIQYATFDGQSCWFLSLTLLGFSSIMGSINYLTTVVKLRCPGMTMFRLPLSVWSLFITAILVLLATPVLAAALTLNLLDHHHLTSFFRPFDWVLSNTPQFLAGGGQPLLHQHLFWFYSHPAVYIMILPAMGMVSDILANGARKPVFGYRPMVYALAGIAFLGFIVWAHHMFQSGMNPTLATTFMVSTIFIAVPSAIKTFNWMGTLWRGNIRFNAPTLHAIAFVSMFVIGGLSGIFMASTPVDVHIHDTYFIVAHIHYVLFGASMFGIFAALTFWYPKMFGRMMSEKLNQVHFWVSFVAFNLTFFPMHILGIGGVARRLYDLSNYPSFQQFQPMNVFMSVSAFVLGAAQVVFAINFIGSWFWGKRAGDNPWEATTLEWTVASPPVHGNFTKVPVVHHGPYEYSSPLVEEDYLVQTRVVEELPRIDQGVVPAH